MFANVSHHELQVRAEEVCVHVHCLTYNRFVIHLLHLSKRTFHLLIAGFNPICRHADLLHTAL